MYKLFLSLRYLRTRPISYIAIGGMALGVAILVVVLSIMGGFQEVLRSKIRGIESDLTLESHYFFGVKNGPELSAELARAPGVQAVAPFVANLCLIRSLPPRSTSDYGFVRGIDPQGEAAVGGFEHYLMSERAVEEYLLVRYLQTTYRVNASRLDEALDKLARTLSAEEIGRLRQNTARRLEGLDDRVVLPEIFTRGNETGFPGVVVGIDLYEHFGLYFGAVISLITSTDVKEMKKSQEQKFSVTGVYRTGYWDQDRRVVYTPIEAAQAFLDIGPTLSGLSVKLDDYTRVRQIKSELETALRLDSTERDHLRLYTWEERKQGLMNAVQMERWLLSVILVFMILLMGLNIVSILVMSVKDKTRDLGILKSLGAHHTGLMTVFLFQGHFFGFFGSLLGVAGGLAFVEYINHIADFIEQITGFHPFPKHIYLLDEIPAVVDPVGIAAAVLVVLVMSLAFSIPAAYLAARMDPVEALRHD